MEKTLARKSTHLRDERDYAIQLAEAKAFFNDEELPTAPKYVLEDNPYADKDGLIEFIIGVELIDDPIVMEKLLTQKKYLIAVTSIVTDYVNRYSEAYGKEFKTDAELWELALSKIPLMGPSKIDEQSYTRHIQGVTIAKEFIEFVLEIVASEGSSALSSFSKFLEKQGDALRFGIEQNKDYYKTMSLGVAVEVFKVGDEVVYAPKVKQYRVNFSRENTKWTSACASYEYVDIAFKYMYAANIFDYEALEDPDIKKDFEKFISDSRKAQIEKASTFFNDDFPPKNPTR